MYVGRKLMYYRTKCANTKLHEIKTKQLQNLDFNASSTTGKRTRKFVIVIKFSFSHQYSRDDPLVPHEPV